MKFLNEIDGANKVKEDSEHQFVTAVEKASWNGKAKALAITVTIAVADWNGGTTATVYAEYVSASNIVIVDPSDANVECTTQGDEELTFSAPATPTEAVTVKVVVL